MQTKGGEEVTIGQWHIDNDVDHKLLQLNDAICSFERTTSREYTLVLIPHDPAEKGHVSVNGKPVTGDDLETAIRLALDTRYGVGKGGRP